MINDLVSVALYNKETVQVQTCALPASPDANTAMYRVLAAKDSGLHQPGRPGRGAGWHVAGHGHRLRHLAPAGKRRAGPDQIQSIAVPKLPDRLALLGSGELKAATLPEPFGTIATRAAQ
jgi:NitT/TauT family transport system substrate-binding protein